MELFKDDTLFESNSGKPLADRMRPRTLDDFVGQEHILGEGKILKLLIEKKDIPSMILWGPAA
jgi:putative ATPase